MAPFTSAAALEPPQPVTVGGFIVSFLQLLHRCVGTVVAAAQDFKEAPTVLNLLTFLDASAPLCGLLYAIWWCNPMVKQLLLQIINKAASWMEKATAAQQGVSH